MSTFLSLNDYPLLQRAVASLGKPLVLADIQFDKQGSATRGAVLCVREQQTLWGTITMTSKDDALPDLAWFNTCAKGAILCAKDLRTVRSALDGYLAQPFAWGGFIDAQDVVSALTKDSKRSFDDILNALEPDRKQNEHPYMRTVILATMLDSFVLDKGVSALKSILQESTTTLPEKNSPQDESLQAQERKKAKELNAKIRRTILQVVDKGEYLSPEKIASIADSLGTTEVKISFMLSDLFENHQIPEFLLADESAQAAIAPVLEQAAEQAGGVPGNVKLKPLRAALAQITGKEFDYLQIRIAIRRYVAKMVQGESHLGAS